MRAFAWIMLLAACGAGPDEDGDGIGARQDCDDANDRVFPDAPERCDGIDNDCDGAVDDDDDTLAPAVTVWFADTDLDGFGGASLGAACEAPAGAVKQDGDCDDTEATIHPGGTELCGSADEDCDGMVDDQDDNLDPASTPVWYRDLDADGFGSGVDLIRQCSQPAGFVADNTDCEDSETGADRYPGAPEICDGKDNDCDIADGLLVDDADPDVDLSTSRTWYIDYDRDGHGDPVSARQACTQPPGTVEIGDDCEDRNRNDYPGNTEVCDGSDNNCDGLIDGADWWDPAWPYRVMVRLDAPPHATQGPPVSVDINFESALTTLGDTSDLDPASLRVVIQDCARGYTEVPSELADNVSRLFANGATASTPGDHNGALLFRYDQDGDYDTSETLAASTSVSVGVYFGSIAHSPGAPAPAYSTSLSSAVAGAAGSRTLTLDSGVSTTVLDETQGGLVDAFALYGQPAGLGAQTGNVFGNGIYFGPAGGGAGASWASGATEAATTFQLVYPGHVMAMSRASGGASNAYGSYTYTWYDWQFAGRPELYAKGTFTLDAASHIGPQGSYWTAAVRPWQIDNVLLVDGGSGGSKDDPGFRWVHGTYPGSNAGVFVGWRVDPLAIGSPFFSNDGRYLAISAQDVEALPLSNEAQLASGTNVLNGSVAIIYPHQGDMNAVMEDFLGVLDGVAVTTLPPEQAP